VLKGTLILYFGWLGHLLIKLNLLYRTQHFSASVSYCNSEISHGQLV